MTNTPALITLPVTVRRYGPGLYDLVDGAGSAVGCIYSKHVAQMIADLLNELGKEMCVYPKESTDA